jgi:hypothetical protein
VVVLGDLNDFEFSQAVGTLKAGVLHDLIETLPQAERYTYDFEGNSQTLDHILLSDALFERPFAYDAVHVNSEFADQASDHDPQVVPITLGPLFDFTGFLPPVRNLPARNPAVAGQVVSVRFSLNGNQGLDIFAPGYPRSRQVPCDSTAPVRATEPTASAGGVGVVFNPGTKIYTYPWQTSASWRGTCRQLVVELRDGSVHRANFQFS